MSRESRRDENTNGTWTLKQLKSAHVFISAWFLFELHGVAIPDPRNTRFR